LRIDVLPRLKNNISEKLTYTINQVGYKYGRIILSWNNIEIEIPFETNYLAQFIEEVETKANERSEYIKWIVYI